MLCVFAGVPYIKRAMQSVACFMVVKVKVKFTVEKVTKAQRGVEVQLCSLFNFGARWEWVVNAKPRPLYPRERPGTHCVGGWVGPRAGLDRCGKSRLPVLWWYDSESDVEGTARRTVPK